MLKLPSIAPVRWLPSRTNVLGARHRIMGNYNGVDELLLVTTGISCDAEIAEQVVTAVNAHQPLLTELRETLHDLREWDGSMDVIEIVERNIEAALAKWGG